MSSPIDSIRPAVVETRRLSVDNTPLFLIEISADGSWRSVYIAPKRLSGWTVEVLPDMPPTAEAEAAVPAWARQRGKYISIQCVPIRRPPARTGSPHRTSE
ncbi:hypothetical protein LFL97_34340 [Burkholderia sp. JSH-S8]|nr:hypothetical protein LFL97_34340 [Burkholderia sp. JSH-S8]